jgi:selenocysteine-specific elongation factor
MPVTLTCGLQVKSMQMFHKPVRYAQQGDRVGICVTNLESSLIERGIATTPGTVSLLSTVICLVRKVRFFKHACKSGSKFHVSIGHTTVTATATFFGAEELEGLDTAHHESTQLGVATSKGQSTLNASYQSGFPEVSFDWSADYEFQDELLGSQYYQDTL